MKKTYDVFDDNGDGRLSVSELGDVLRSLNLNPTKAEIQEIMDKADIDGTLHLFYLLNYNKFSKGSIVQYFPPSLSYHL